MLRRPILPVLAIFLSVAIQLTAPAAYAHEFWIEPVEYQVQNGAPLEANLRNGQEFSGTELAYFSKSTARFELLWNGQTSPVAARMGDIPALQATAPADALLVILHQTTPSLLTYATWEKFAAFAKHKDFPDIRARHVARGLPDEKFTETYARYAKALVGVGTAVGADAPTGMEIEFVALSNPYTDDPTAGFTVQLLYQGGPLTDTQIEVFARSPDDLVNIFLHNTDAQGRALIPVIAGYTYLLDAVVLRNAPAEGKAVWQTLWAALSFAVPE